MFVEHFLTFVVTEPDTLKALFSDTTDAVCSYSANGQAIVTPTGGTPIYTYDWYDVAGGDTDSVASGIIPGTYHVEVTDANGCLDTGEVVVGSPAPLDLVPDSVVSTCSGICDGVAIIRTSGGNPPLRYTVSSLPGQEFTTAANPLTIYEAMGNAVSYTEYMEDIFIVMNYILFEF